MTRIVDLVSLLRSFGAPLALVLVVASWSATRSESGAEAPQLNEPSVRPVGELVPALRVQERWWLNGTSPTFDDAPEIVEVLDARALALLDERTEAIGLPQRGSARSDLIQLRRFPNLVHLKIRLVPTARGADGELDVEGGWKFFESLPALTHLDIDGIPGRAIPLVAQNTRLRSLRIRSLRSFNAPDSDAPPQGTSKQFDCLATAHHLTEIWLPPETPSGVADGVLGKHPFLRSLRLAGATGAVQENSGERKFFALDHLPALRELDSTGVRHFVRSASEVTELVLRRNLETLTLAVDAHDDVRAPSSLELPASEWVRSPSFASGTWPALRRLKLTHGYAGNGAAGEPTRFFYGAGGSGTAQVPDGLPLLRNLEELVIEDSATLRGDLLFRALATLPKLKSLRLVRCPSLAVPDDFAPLAQLRNLTLLDLTGCANISDDVMLQVAKIPNLQRLVIDDCHRLSAAGVRHLRSAKTLQHMSWRTFGTVDDLAVSTICAHLEGLTSLRLHRRSLVSRMGVKAIADRGRWIELWLPGSPDVETSGANIDQATLKHMVARSPGLQSLSLQVAADQADQLDALRDASSLTCVSLAFPTRLTHGIAVQLGKLPALRQIELPRNSGPLADSEANGVLAALKTELPMALTVRRQ